MLTSARLLGGAAKPASRRKRQAVRFRLCSPRHNRRSAELTSARYCGAMTEGRQTRSRPKGRASKSRPSAQAPVPPGCSSRLTKARAVEADQCHCHGSSALRGGSRTCSPAHHRSRFSRGQGPGPEGGCLRVSLGGRSRMAAMKRFEATQRLRDANDRRLIRVRPNAAAPGGLERRVPGAWLVESGALRPRAPGGAPRACGGAPAACRTRCSQREQLLSGNPRPATCLPNQALPTAVALADWVGARRRFCEEDSSNQVQQGQPGPHLRDGHSVFVRPGQFGAAGGRAGACSGPAHGSWVGGINLPPVGVGGVLASDPRVRAAGSDLGFRPFATVRWPLFSQHGEVLHPHQFAEKLQVAPYCYFIKPWESPHRFDDALFDTSFLGGTALLVVNVPHGLTEEDLRAWFRAGLVGGDVEVIEITKKIQRAGEPPEFMWLARWATPCGCWSCLVPFSARGRAVC